MQTKAFSLAASALLLSAGAVSAATVTDNLNLRSGPGTSYSVIGWMPVGSDILVLSCGRSWCRVMVSNGTEAYASRKFISSSGAVYAASPAAGVVAPDNGYGNDYGYGYTQSPWTSNVGLRGWRYNRYNWYR